MCCVYVGTTTIAPSQNSFLSMPLQILPEEARLLLAKGVAYLIPDTPAHLAALSAMTPERRRAYVGSLRKTRKVFEQARAEERKRSREESLKKKIAQGKIKVKSKCKVRKEQAAGHEESPGEGVAAPEPESLQASCPSRINDDAEASLFGLSSTTADISPSSRSVHIPTITLELVKLSVTPTSSYPDLLTPPRSFSIPSTDPPPPAAPESLIITCPSMIPAPKSFPLYAHLHKKGYWMTPGLRFGADYSVYPGDPMRFHAHFLASAFDWDEEIDILQIVGLGRLATAVKKGFVIGGEATRKDNDDGEKEELRDSVRVFSMEWAGM